MNPTASEKLEWITAKANEGRTVIVSTHLRAYSIKSKHLALLSVRGQSLYLRSGNGSVCIDGCRISAIK